MSSGCNFFVFVLFVLFVNHDLYDQEKGFAQGACKSSLSLVPSSARRHRFEFIGSTGTHHYIAGPSFPRPEVHPDPTSSDEGREFYTVEVSKVHANEKGIRTAMPHLSDALADVLRPELCPPTSDRSSRTHKPMPRLGKDMDNGTTTHGRSTPSSSSRMDEPTLLDGVPIRPDIARGPAVRRNSRALARIPRAKGRAKSLSSSSRHCLLPLLHGIYKWPIWCRLHWVRLLLLDQLSSKDLWCR